MTTRALIGVGLLAVVVAGCGGAPSHGSGPKAHGSAGRVPSDQRPAPAIEFPSDLDFARDGSLYITDAKGGRVFRYAHRQLTVVAGDGWRDRWGKSRFSGDGGPAVEASLNWPSNVAVGPHGTIYIADSRNCRVRAVDSRGLIRSVAGNCIPDPGTECIRELGNGKPAADAAVSPEAVAAGPDGSLYIAESGYNQVRRVDPSGVIAVFAGVGGRGGDSGDGGAARDASLNWPRRVRVAPDGSVYIADTKNHRVRRVNRQGRISTVAGDGWKQGPDGEGRFAGDGGAATKASLWSPTDVAFGADGSWYIADSLNYRIRKVDPHGIITTVAGDGRDGYTLGAENGVATEISLNPDALAVGPAGELWMTDLFEIRKLDPRGMITTVLRARAPAARD